MSEEASAARNSKLLGQYLRTYVYIYSGPYSREVQDTVVTVHTRFDEQIPERS